MTSLAEDTSRPTSSSHVGATSINHAVTLLFMVANLDQTISLSDRPRNKSLDHLRRLHNNLIYGDKISHSVMRLCMVHKMTTNLRQWRRHRRWKNFHRILQHFFKLRIITLWNDGNHLSSIVIIIVLYSMPAAGKLSLGDSVPAAAKLA